MLMGCAIGGCCCCWNGLRTPATGWLSMFRFGGSFELLTPGLKAFGRIGCGSCGSSTGGCSGGGGGSATDGAGGGGGCGAAGCGAVGCGADGAGAACVTGGGVTGGGAIGADGALYVPEVEVVPNTDVCGNGGGAAKDGVGGGAAGDCGVDGSGGGVAKGGVGGGADGIGGGADGCGADDDSGDEYVKLLGLGNGVDSGMDVDGNCGGCASCEGCAVGATGVPQPRQTLSLAARIRPHFLQSGILISG